MNAFDIIGPVMVGPSSSHTAGAVRIGLAARELLGSQPREAAIHLHGSFARTYRGHGTDKAILAGLLGFAPDDGRIRMSPQFAAEAGMSFAFDTIDLPNAHPNTAVIELRDAAGSQVTVRGASIGGGGIVIESIDDLAVSFSGSYHTLVIAHKDTPGVVAAVAGRLADERINIASMKVFRACRGGGAVMVIETDQAAGEGLKDRLRGLAGIRRVSVVRPL